MLKVGITGGIGSGKSAASERMSELGAHVFDADKEAKQILAENEITPQYPEDMMSLMRRALRLINHLESNRKDRHNSRQLELTESKIRRLARYYKGRGLIETEWAYKRDQLRLLVE